MVVCVCNVVCLFVCNHACLLATSYRIVVGLVSLVCPGTSIPIHGGLSLRPVKNRGGVFFYLYRPLVHFDICTTFCPKCILMAAGGRGGEEVSEMGE